MLLILFFLSQIDLRDRDEPAEVFWVRFGLQVEIIILLSLLFPCLSEKESPPWPRGHDIELLIVTFLAWPYHILLIGVGRERERPDRSPIVTSQMIGRNGCRVI